MQNKPNFLDALMNLKSFHTVDYENIANCKLCENKPNTNPIKPNFLKDKTNANLFAEKDYENKPRLRTPRNKPNQTQFQTQRTLCEFFLFFTFLFEARHR